MALDRDAERILEMARLSGQPPYETLSAPEARKLFLAAREVLAPDPPPVAKFASSRHRGGPVWLSHCGSTAARKRPPATPFPPSSTSMAAAG